MRFGKRRQMGLGPIHTTNLAEARVRARQMRQLILDGKDPLGVKRDAITAERIAAAKQVTFKQCADEFLRTSPVAKTWTNDVHRKQWRQTLEDYAFPVLGAVPVGQIDVALVKKALTPIWNDAPVTASRLRGRIELVLVYATASGLREGDNPAAWRGNLKAIFGRPPQQEHPRGVALRRTAGIYAALARDRPARAVEFMILTGVRLSEARNAAWDEIDDNVWTIPAERMKGNKEHRVPLPPPVCDLLESLPRVGGIVFGDASRNALLAAVKAINPDVTAHGFRSTFRTWIAERTSYPEAVAEQALAHAVSGAVLKAYRRTDLFDRRRRLMAEWARYCYSPVVASGQVVALHG